MKKHKCSICKKNYQGYGNNAEPINKGRCCDDCNMLVIARRLDDISKALTNKAVKKINERI